MVYDKIDEAVEKAEYYVRHPAEASEIALAGYRKVKPHSYLKRAHELLWKIKS